MYCLSRKGLRLPEKKQKRSLCQVIVFVDGQREDKAGTAFPEDVSIEVRGHTLPYVSRGGLKLEKALEKL